jgi:hypothetical protein
VSGAMDVLHAKIRLKEYFGSDEAALLAIAMAEVAVLRLPPEHTDRNWADLIKGVSFDAKDPAQDMPSAYKARDFLVRHIDFAVPYWVSEEMAMMTMHAANSRGSGIVSLEDFPTQQGFVWFEQPLLLELQDPDGETETLSIKIFTWRQGTNVLGEPGMSLTYWSQPGQHSDTLGQLLQTSGQRPFMKAGPYIVAQQGFLPFGVEQEHPMWWQQFAATFGHLIEQKVAVTRIAPPDKKMARLVRRANINANTVSVVTLRHVSDRPVHTGTGRTLSVRFLRGGRTGGWWQTVRYGPGRIYEKKIWQMPYMVGPEGAPIVWRTDVIYRWTR